jgi:tetratricopeptide (TPR) repeat protein
MIPPAVQEQDVAPILPEQIDPTLAPTLDSLPRPEPSDTTPEAADAANNPDVLPPEPATVDAGMPPGDRDPSPSSSDDPSLSLPPPPTQPSRVVVTDPHRVGERIAQGLRQAPSIASAVPRPMTQNSCGRSRAVPIPSLAQRMAARIQRPTPDCPFPKFTTSKILHPTADLAAIAQETPKPWGGSWVFPLPIVAPVTSGFGWRIHPITGDRRFHEGIDFGAPEGTPVLAAAAGDITTAGWMGGYGLTVVIRHSAELETLYAHLSKITVQPGQRVAAGAPLGHVGSTGNSTGPHLHFEERQHRDGQWIAVNPSGILAEPVAPPPSNPPDSPPPEPPDATLPRVVVAKTASLAPCRDQCGDTSLEAVAVASLPPLPEVPTVPEEPPRAAQAAIAPAAPRPLPQHLPRAESQSLEQWLEDCQQWVNEGQYGLALATCDRAIGHSPRSPEAWLSRGRLLMALGRYPEAIAALSYVLEQVPQSSQVLTDRCSAYARNGDIFNALRDCDRALALDQDWGDRSPALAYQHRGLIYLQAEDYEPALAAFDQILQQNPNHSLALTYRCRVELALGQTDTALATCDRAIAADQSWGDASPALAWYHRGLALTQQTQLTAALTAYDQALALEPSQATLWIHRGLTLEALGRWHEALIDLQQATQLAPASSLAWVSQAAVLNHLNQPTAALAAADQALQGDGQWGDRSPADVWQQQARAHLNLGNYTAALAATDYVISHHPNHAQAWSDRALALAHLGQPTDALTAIHQALDERPSAALLLKQGQVLALAGQDADAIAIFDTAIQTHPPHHLRVDLLTQRSLSLWRMGDLEAALTATQTLLSADPTTVQGWQIQGMVLLSLNRFEDAIAAYDYALALDPNNIQSLTGRGTALRYAGQEEAATAAFRQAEALRQQQPSSETAS